MDTQTIERGIIESPRQELASLISMEKVFTNVSANLMRNKDNERVRSIINYAETAQSIIFNQEGRSFEDSVISLLQNKENTKSVQWANAIGLELINQAASLDSEEGFNRVAEFINSISENPSLDIPDSFIRMMNIKFSKEKALYYIKTNNTGAAKMQVVKILQYANKNGRAPEASATMIYNKLLGVNEQRANSSSQPETTSSTIKEDPMTYEEEIASLLRNTEGESNMIQAIIDQNLEGILTQLTELQGKVTENTFNQIIAVMLRNDINFDYLPKLFALVSEDKKIRIYAGVGNNGKQTLEHMFSLSHKQFFEDIKSQKL